MATSLLQFNGQINQQGVRLLFYPVTKEECWDEYHGPNSRTPNPEATTFCKPAEYVTLIDKEGKERKLPRLYRAWRKPAGSWGCWVVFRYNGKEHVPDLSVPISILKLPRDAKPLSDKECADYWFS